MRIRRAVLNATLVLASIAIALVACELGARLVLNPADYLSATTVGDEVLGLKIAPGAPGFDAWGFRNPKVPPSADIVAIGDSHTYGNNATLAEAWPAVVGRVNGRATYNLALGGYGPNQYYELLRTRGLRLKPRWVVCGLYMGDDFENAFLMTYGKEHWASLRQGHWPGVQADIWQTGEAPGALKPLRLWLSRTSIIYRLVVHGPVLGQLKGALQIREASHGDDPAVTSLTLPAAGISEAFRPLGIRDRVYQQSPPVREGMRITFELLGRMDRACRAEGCQLVVVVIPTKETVFAEHLLRAPDVRLRDVIAELVDHEQAARARLEEFLDRAGILHVDALPALRRHLGEQLYTRSAGDMHPNRNGYRVIGEVVAQFLAQREAAAVKR